MLLMLRPRAVAAAAVVGQPGAVVTGVVAGKAPSRRLATVTTVETSGARPTAPFQVNNGAVVGGKPASQGTVPLVAPSVVAGSPRVSGVALTALNGLLKTYGNWVAGWPAAMSASPERG